MRKSDIAVSSVVGNVLLVAIVFLMGAMFAGMVVVNDFEPTPDATINIEQTNDCESVEDGGCEAVVMVDQMDNADYIIVTYNIPSGYNQPETATDLISDVPIEVDEAPNEPQESASIDEDDNDISAILLGAGDAHTGSDMDVGTEIHIYAGIDGNEDLIESYTVQENTVTFG